MGLGPSQLQYNHLTTKTGVSPKFSYLPTISVALVVIFLNFFQMKALLLRENYLNTVLVYEPVNEILTKQQNENYMLKLINFHTTHLIGNNN